MEVRQYNVVDLHAPRYRPKRFDILAEKNRPFYSAMKEQHPELKKYTNQEIARCIEFYNVRIAQEIINNRNGVRLPDGLGVAVAGACTLSKEAAKKNIDHKTSTQLGVPVPYQNLHSDGYIAKVKYSNEMDSHMFDNHNMWCFDACRKLARAVSSEFMNGNHQNYIVFTAYQHVTTLFRKPKIYKESAKNVQKKKEQLNQHDEFAFN